MEDKTEGIEGSKGTGRPKKLVVEDSHDENFSGAIDKAQDSIADSKVETAGKESGLKGALSTRREYYKHLLRGGAFKSRGNSYLDRQAEVMWNSGLRLPLKAVDKARTLLQNRLVKKPLIDASQPPNKV